MYKFYLDGYELPLTPSKLKIKINNNNKTVELINIGEVNFLKVPKLTDISFEFRLISKDMYHLNAASAESALSKLENLKLFKEPFRFIVTRAGEVGFEHDMNMLVSLEDYTITEDAEQGSDIFVSVNLKQYRSFGVKKIKVAEEVKLPSSPKLTPKLTTKSKTKKKSKKVTKTVRPSKPQPPAVTVKKGENAYLVSKIARGEVKGYTLALKQNDIKNPWNFSVEPKKIVYNRPTMLPMKL